MTRLIPIALLLALCANCAARRASPKPHISGEFTQVYWGDLADSLEQAQSESLDFRLICLDNAGSEPSAEMQRAAQQAYAPMKFSPLLADKSSEVCANDFTRGLGNIAIWAEGNARESLLAGIKREEVYVSSGPHIRLRFFGGWNFKTKHIKTKNLTKNGYHYGVPMGGDLKLAPEGKPPRFIMYAFKDPKSANLEKLQIIKRWVEANGEPYQRTYDVMIVSKNKDKNGDQVQGSEWLSAKWIDPDFSAKQRIQYFMRAVEVTTPGQQPQYAVTAPITYQP